METVERRRARLDPNETALFVFMIAGGNDPCGLSLQALSSATTEFCRITLLACVLPNLQQVLDIKPIVTIPPAVEAKLRKSGRRELSFLRWMI